MRFRLPIYAAFGLGLILINLAWSKPYYNWDLLAYLGVAYGFGGASPEQAHERAYLAVREGAPASDYRLFTEGDEYRSTLSRDVRAFSEQLPVYRMKVAYPWLIYRLEQAGIEPVRASILISRAAYIAIGLILLAWLSALLPWGAAWATAFVVMSMPFTLALARFSTPDALSTFFVLTALWLAFQRGSPRAGMAVLLVSIAVRPDNALWLFAMSGCCVARDRRQWPVAAAFTAAGAMLSIALALWAGDPGFATQFHHAFVERLPYQRDFRAELSVIGYLKIYLRQTHPMHLPPFLLLFALIGGWLMSARQRTLGWNDWGVGVLMVFGTFIVMHWLLYPGEERFFVAGYLATMIVLAGMLAGPARRSEAVPGG